MELTDRRVLVVGGAGFIGSHLVDALADLDIVVVSTLAQIDETGPGLVALEIDPEFDGQAVGEILFHGRQGHIVVCTVEFETVHQQ